MHADVDKWVFFKFYVLWADVCFIKSQFDRLKFFNIPMSEHSNLLYPFHPCFILGFFPSIAILRLHSLHPSEDGISSLYSMLAKIKMLC